MEPLAEKPVVSLEKTAIGYDPDKVILENIRLSVMPGEMVALVGRNGTGKSTLLKSIIGLPPLLAGDCSLFGSPIEKLNLRRRALLVSYVSSRIPDMPPTSVRELVSLGRMPHTGWTGRHREQDRKLVKQAVSELGMENFTERKRKPLKELMKDVDLNFPVIMMDHQPFALGKVADALVDIQFSGHTHHGQLFPFNFITNMVYQKSWGYLRIKDSHFYVSSGYGNWGPPIRTGNTTEIVNIILKFTGK